MYTQLLFIKQFYGNECNTKYFNHQLVIITSYYYNSNHYPFVIAPIYNYFKPHLAALHLASPPLLYRIIIIIFCTLTVY